MVSLAEDLASTSSRKLNQLFSGNVSYPLRVEVLITNLLSSLERGEFQESRQPRATSSSSRKSSLGKETTWDSDEEEDLDDDEREGMEEEFPTSFTPIEEIEIHVTEEAPLRYTHKDKPLSLHIKLPNPQPLLSREETEETHEVESESDCESGENERESSEGEEEEQEKMVMMKEDFDPFEILPVPEPLEFVTPLSFSPTKRKVDQLDNLDDDDDSDDSNDSEKFKTFALLYSQECAPESLKHNTSPPSPKKVKLSHDEHERLRKQ